MSASTTRAPLTMKLCWAGALLPVCLAFLFHLIGPSAQGSPAKRTLPGLSFSQYMVDEGLPPARPYYHARFSFKNTSDETVTVTELKPSCGCLNPKLEKRVYKPGETGEFFLRVDPTKEKSGPHEYFVDVVYNDPKPREARVTYKLTLPERKIEIAPKALVFYQLSDNDKETSQAVVISDYRSRHFHVTGIESTSPLAKARLLNVEVDDSDNQHVELEITVAGKVPAGTSRAIINVSTDDEVFKVLQVPILISGPTPKVSAADLPLKLDPKSIYLRADKTGTIETSLTLHDFQPYPVTLTKLSLEAIQGEVSAGTVESSSLGPLARKQKLELSLQVPKGVSELNCLLVIETDSNLQPRLEVPIVIEVGQ